MYKVKIINIDKCYSPWIRRDYKTGDIVELSNVRYDRNKAGLKIIEKFKMIQEGKKCLCCNQWINKRIRKIIKK